jgi:hypothetical protein
MVKRVVGKAAASEAARHTLFVLYVEPLSDARTQRTALFTILPRGIILSAEIAHNEHS